MGWGLGLSWGRSLVGVVVVFLLVRIERLAFAVRR